MEELKKTSLADKISNAAKQSAPVSKLEAVMTENAELKREIRRLQGREEQIAQEVAANLEARLRMELAYEIFGEIQSRLAQFSHYRVAAVEGIIKMISSLKKKYTEGGRQDGDQW